MTGNANIRNNDPHPMVQSTVVPRTSLLVFDLIGISDSEIIRKNGTAPFLSFIGAYHDSVNRPASYLKFPAVEAEMEKGCHNCAYFLFKEACSGEDLSPGSGKCFLGFVEKNRTQWVQGDHVCENWSWESVSVDVRS